MMNINEKFSKIEDYTSEKYLDYAVAVCKDRAIPYLMDGLKPVHRRILYAMSVMGIKAGQGHKKSARIVGDVIGKYHPHGDTAVYESMVRMSQDWVMRYPIIDGQGNFGSRDGDGAAAMRYTESSLTEYAEQILLSELKEGTSDFVPNYDGNTVEVDLFSSRLNNMLLNGATGIAVGMATNIPSHNIREVTNATLAYIDNNNISIDEIMEHIKGPDFAAAGQIISSKETIIDAYKTGMGKIRVRARWHLEKLARGQWQIVITQLPPDVSILDVLNTIDKITNPPMTKDKKGKPKALSATVLQSKTFLNSILAKGRDDTDAKSGDRLVLEPKSSRQDPEEFMNALIPRLNLETTFGVNLVAVGEDGKPELKNIKSLISEWVAYRLNVIKRRLNFHLNKIQKRIHIIEGRLKVYTDLDEAISIIRESEDPKTDLIEKFLLTEIQAEDILEIKLRQLAKLEHDKLSKELEKLKTEEERLIKLLSSEKRLFTLMKKEIEADTVKFEDGRRTILEEAKTIVAKTSEAVIDEAITIIYTKDGWITQRKGHNYDLSNYELKTGDSIESIQECRSIEPIVFLASNGRGYSLKSNEIPSGKNSVHVNSLIDLKGCDIVDMFIGRETDKRLFANSTGYGFISATSNLVSKNKAGKHFMSISGDNFTIFKPMSFNENLVRINALTTDNRLLSFHIEEMKELDKGKGVQIVRLVDDNQIKEISISANDEIPVMIKNKKKIFREEDLEPFLSKRARRGKAVKDDYSLVDNT